MNVGKRIKKARLSAGLTQVQLGARCGMADSAIRRYESGKVIPKFDTLVKIGEALGEDPIFLQTGHRTMVDTVARKKTTFERSLESKKALFDLQLFAEDEQLTRLTANYDALNDHSRGRLVEYSDDLVSNPQNRRDPDDE